MNDQDWNLCLCIIILLTWIFMSSNSMVFFLIFKWKLRIHNNHRWSSAALRNSLVSSASFLCLPTWVSPAIPQKSYVNWNQPVARLHPQGWGEGIMHTTSSCSQTKTYTKLTRLSVAFSAGCSAAVVLTVTVRCHCWWKTLTSGLIAWALIHMRNAVSLALSHTCISSL